MIEQQVVLEYHADAALFWRYEDVRGWPVEHTISKHNVTAIKRRQTGQRFDGGGLACPIWAKQCQCLTRCNGDRQIEHKSIWTFDYQVGVKAGHSCTAHDVDPCDHQRSLNSNNTARDTATSTRLIATAVSRSCSSATKTASGKV